jgi:hypothetical protein
MFLAERFLDRSASFLRRPDQTPDPELGKTVYTRHVEGGGGSTYLWKGVAASLSRPQASHCQVHDFSCQLQKIGFFAHFSLNVGKLPVATLHSTCIPSSGKAFQAEGVGPRQRRPAKDPLVRFLLT